MFKNYLKIAFRNLSRQKFFSTINIVGLAIGLACSILLSLWIYDEYSYDRFHQNGKNIYRVLEDQKYSSQSMQVAVTPVPLAEAMKKEFPEITAVTRYNLGGARTVKVADKEFENISFSYADKGFLSIFSFPVLRGSFDPDQDKFSVAMTESAAKKLFGEEEALGQIINKFDIDFKITAILKDIPENSHLSFDYLLPFQILIDRNPNLNNWGSNSIYTYLQLVEGVSFEQFNKKIKGFLKTEIEDGASDLYLQPLQDVYLHSVGLVADFGTLGDFKYIILFGIISIFVIIISSVNFISLSTARYTKRAKEVGLRKVVGSLRSQLITQFLSETFLLLLIAVLISIIMVEAFLPYFNHLSGKTLSLSKLLEPLLFSGFLVLVLLLGFLTGIYPAFLLSSFKPVTVLKGSQISGEKGAIFRKIVVVTQWTLSIILIISTIMISRQLSYMKNKKLGFQKEQVVYTFFQGIDNPEALKAELLKNPCVEQVSACSDLPVNIMSSTSGAVWEGCDAESSFLIHFNVIDYDFIETLQIEIAEGRSFSPEFADDVNFGYLLNQEAVKQMNLKNPVGKKFSVWGMEGQIVGVMKDFHFKPLHNPIEPMMFVIAKDYLECLVARISTSDQENTLKYMKDTMQKFQPEAKFGFSFLDEQYDALYKAEQQMEAVLKIFTTLAIFVACLGLFGLSTFMTQQRTKEVGIRKVLGANVSSILFILSKEFTKWVILANIIACPAAYYIIDKLLENYAYRINIGYGVFLVTISASILLAILTVSLQTFKAACSNPVDALKYE